MRKILGRISVVVVLLSFTGCTYFCEKRHEDMTPEEVVEAYLDIALNMDSIEQRENLSHYTTGVLKAAIEGATDETIREAYIDKNYLLERYSVVERKDRTPKETEITFELAYKELGKEGKTKPEDAAAVTTENTVAVVKESRRWLIRDVLNKKSTFDFPTSMGATIEAKSP